MRLRRVTVSRSVAMAMQIVPPKSMRSAPSSSSISVTNACVAPLARRAACATAAAISGVGALAGGDVDEQPPQFFPIGQPVERPFPVAAEEGLEDGVGHPLRVGLGVEPAGDPGLGEPDQSLEVVPEHLLGGPLLLSLGSCGLRLLGRAVCIVGPGNGSPDPFDQAGFLGRCRRGFLDGRRRLLVGDWLPEPLEELAAVAAELVRRAVLEATVRTEDHACAARPLTPQSIARS